MRENLTEWQGAGPQVCFFDSFMHNTIHFDMDKAGSQTNVKIPDVKLSDIKASDCRTRITFTPQSRNVML